MGQRTTNQEFNVNIYTKITDNIYYRFLAPVELWFYRFLSDEQFTRRMYRKIFDREVNLDNPSTFNEKILYLKLYCEQPEYPALADKYAVREFVRARGLDHLLNEVYGVYDRVEQIDFASLPGAFIMQATHGSGWNIICTDKAAFDWPQERAKARGWLKKNFYWNYRETVYKHIQPRIMVSRYLQSENGHAPNDYKFFCFHGQPEYIQVDSQRYSNHHRDFYDIQWKRLPLSVNYPNLDKQLEKPGTMDEMIEVSKILSQGFPFMRVDLYSPAGQVIFGELTLYPGGGFTRFNPERFDEIFGRKLHLKPAK